MNYRVGVDIGGTFTDFAVLDAANRLYTLKVFSTPGKPGGEVIAGIAALRERYGIRPEEISYFTHGTTVGVNSVIQRNGAVLCLITTENFQDVLELGRLKTPEVYSLYSRRPKPLISKDHVFQVRERMLHDGTVATKLDEAGAREAIARAVALGAGGLVVALINSYRNPAHEQRIRALAAEIAPDLLVTCSSDVWPVVREYERTVTAVLNAYVRPRMAHYLTSLQMALREAGVPAEAQITKSNGGIMRAELGKTACVDVLLSGTASGVTGACHVAKLGGFRNVASLDIGGTSADVALIIDGQAQYGTGEQIGEFALYVPSVSVASIGGGGGSIARVNEQGVLKSGPASAGSEPGPACYGRGGTNATTTDAFVLCGFLGQTELAYGAVSIDRAKAEAAIAPIASALGQSVTQAAESIIKVATSGMYAEMTRVFARHGMEAKSFTLMAFGGAGPMMACFVAREAGIGHVLVPPTPGVLSALGGLVCDTRNDFIRTLFQTLSPALVDTLKTAYAELETQARAWLRDEQMHSGEATLRFSADMRYAGQSFEIETKLELDWVTAGDIAALAGAFHAEHLRLYDHNDPDAAVQIINARVVISAPNPRPDFVAAAETPYDAVPDRSVAVFHDGAMVEAALFRREALQPGARFTGPAIIAQNDTTTCLPAGFAGRVDGWGNLVLAKTEGAP
jgi:N-methylhydantoinase A